MPVRRLSRRFAESHPTLVALGLYLYLTLLGAGGIYLYTVASAQRDQIQATADQSHRALCALRGDLNQRITDSRVFLSKHPQGIPGISRADIQLSITNQQRTIDTLRFLNCKENP